ncbi:MAG: glycosyltransferase, partial [Solirubrobacteraceae bacterium]
MEGKPRFSVVVTVYQSEQMLPAVIDRLTELQTELSCPVEAIFVIDDSPDNSLMLLRRLLSEPRPFDAQLIALSRNFGAVNAGRVGVTAAEGDVIAVHASDLQEPLSLLRDFYEALSSGGYDVAFGVRRSRADPWRSRTAAALYWRVYRRFVQPSMPRHGVDVFACTKRVADEISGLKETHSSIIGLLLWVGFRRIEIPYDRLERRVGKSSWSFRK